MISTAHDPSLYAQWLERIKSPATQDAFRYLIGAAACLRDLTCHAQLKGPEGPLHDVRFSDMSSEQHFAFIVNQGKGLLFYFRAPAVRSGRYNFEQLQSQFSSAAENSRAEWSLRINTLEDATRLWLFLDLK